MTGRTKPVQINRSTPSSGIPAKLFRCGLLLLYLLWGLSGQAGAQSASEPVILESGEAGLTLAWTPPAHILSVTEVDGLKYSQLRMRYTSPSAQPGYPEVPLYSGLIGLPATGEARLQVIELQEETVALPDLPLPAPSPQTTSLSPAEIDPFSGWSERVIHQPDPTLYAIDAFYPAQVAQLGQPRQLRDRRVAALAIYPLQVNPVTGKMKIIQFIRLKITFTEPATSNLGGQAGANPLTQPLRSILLNPEAAGWAGRPAQGDGEPPDLSAASTGPTFKVKVAEPGLYGLSYGDLQKAGLPLATLDPRTLKLSHGYPRQEVSILVEGETDGVFNSSDRILFYTEPAFSRYVDEDVYFLNFGGSNGLRMGSRSGNPAGTAWRVATAEINHYYDPLYPARNGDPWY
jgi:hypothetical protein